MSFLVSQYFDKFIKCEKKSSCQEKLCLIYHQTPTGTYRNIIV